MILIENDKTILYQVPKSMSADTISVHFHNRLNESDNPQILAKFKFGSYLQTPKHSCIWCGSLELFTMSPISLPHGAGQEGMSLSWDLLALPCYLYRFTQRCSQASIQIVKKEHREQNKYDRSSFLLIASLVPTLFPRWQWKNVPIIYGFYYLYSSSAHKHQ